MNYYEIKFKINFHNEDDSICASLPITSYQYGKTALEAFNNFHREKDKFTNLFRGAQEFKYTIFSDEVITLLASDEVIKIMNEMY